MPPNDETFVGKKPISDFLADSDHADRRARLDRRGSQRQHAERHAHARGHPALQPASLQQLASIYLEHRRSMELENRGGAVGRGVLQDRRIPILLGTQLTDGKTLDLQ